MPPQRLLLALAAATLLLTTAALAAAEPTASADPAAAAPAVAALADDALYAAAEAALVDQDSVVDGQAVDDVSVPAFLVNAPQLDAAATSLPSSPPTVTTEALSASAFAPIATYGTVPDSDTASASTFRGVDLAVDGDAVYLALQEGALNWRGSVFRVDGATPTSPPRPVAGSPGFTPGPAVDLTLAAAGGTLAVAYREGVYHHGYYRAGDDSWVYTSRGGGRFAQTGGPFTNARPRDLTVALSSSTPVVAYADDEYELRATVRALAKDGSWPTVGEQGLSAGAVSGVRVAVDPASSSSSSSFPLYIAYSDTSCDGKATVKRYDGANWTAVGRPCLTPGKATGLSLTLVPGNATVPSAPCLSYGSYDGGAVVCYADGEWRLVGGAPFSTTRTNATSLAFDSSRASLIVSYRDGGYGGRVSVSRVDAGGWRVVGTRGFSNDAVWRTRLAVTPRGATFVAYEIGGGMDETDGVVVERMK